MASDDDSLCFHVDDICTRKSDDTAVGYVESTHGEVDSHSSHPRNDFGKVHRHRAVPRKLHQEFLREGVPPKGHVLVHWQTEDKVELVPCSDLVLLDRLFMNGDLVRKGDKSGTVVSKRVTCTLVSLCDVLEPKSGKVLKAAWMARSAGEEHALQAINDGSVLYDIPSSELKLAQTYDEEDIIIYKNWVGRIKECFDEVTVRLADGGVVTITDDEDLEEVGGDSDNRLSVGSLVKTKKGTLRRGRWVFGQYSPNTAPVGVVVDIRIKECDVDWIQQRLRDSHGSFSLDSVPDQILGLDELESGEVCLYDVSAKPREGPSEQNPTKSWSDPDTMQGGRRVRFRDLSAACVKYDGSTAHGKLEKIDRMETLGYDMNVFTVSGTLTKVDVLWSDLTMSTELATSVVLDPSTDDEDAIFTREIVCSRETRTQPSQVAPDWAVSPAKVGIAERVDSKERVAFVRWFHNSTLSFFEKEMRIVVPGSLLGSPGETLEEVSFYDIRAPKSVNRERGDFVQLPKSPEDQIGGTTWFGEVVDLSMDGKCTVRLGAAEPVTDIECHLTDTFATLNEDLGDDFNGDADGFGEGSGYEYSDSDVDMEDLPWYEDGGDMPIDDSDDSWSTESEAQMEDVDAESTNGDQPTASQPEEPRPSDTAGGLEQEHKEDGATNANQPPDPVQELQLSSLPNAPASYEILETAVPASHHYAGNEATISSLHMKRVRKEHRILCAEGALPEGVYVRTWESRMDLIRVLFVGPLGTPYEYAPFMLDLGLPPTFPHEPPKAFFHSWTAEGAGAGVSSGRVNPNLYEEGKVCLSLLGTWQGDRSKNEGWVPNQSTILQVLVSILGLVLVKEPYYNEAGYEPLQASSSSRQNSTAYTERTYLRARAFLISPLNRLAQNHFTGLEGMQDVLRWLYLHKEGPNLLSKAIGACETILQNSETEESSMTPRDGLTSVSRGAALPLKRVLRRLEELSQHAT